MFYNPPATSYKVKIRSKFVQESNKVKIAKRAFADVESDSSGDDICVMQKSKAKKF